MDWVALAGAVVGTTALVWNIARERQKVLVQVRYAQTTGIPSQELVAIEVINKGRCPINIQEVGFLRSDRKALISTEWHHNLGWVRDGDGATCYIPKQDMDAVVEGTKRQGMRIVAAYVRDSTNRRYRGKIKPDFFI
jgi:hypothetical protein